MVSLDSSTIHVNKITRRQFLRERRGGRLGAVPDLVRYTGVIGL